METPPSNFKKRLTLGERTDLYKRLASYAVDIREQYERIENIAYTTPEQAKVLIRALRSIERKEEGGGQEQSYHVHDHIYDHYSEKSVHEDCR